MEKFWNKWNKLEELEQIDHVTTIVDKLEQGFSAYNEIYDESDVDSLALKSAKAQLLNSYFTDLREVLGSETVEEGVERR